MKVKGTVLMSFEVEVDSDDISEDTMTMYESDVLIVQAIDKLMPKGFYVERDIHVTSPSKATVLE